MFFWKKIVMVTSLQVQREGSFMTVERVVSLFRVGRS